jgi:hypothetical protein
MRENLIVNVRCPQPRTILCTPLTAAVPILSPWTRGMVRIPAAENSPDSFVRTELPGNELESSPRESSVVTIVRVVGVADAPAVVVVP